MLRFCLRGCRNDYIAEIQVVYRDSDELPTGQGWELVEKTVSGKSANLNQVRITCGLLSTISGMECGTSICYNSNRKVADLAHVSKDGAAVRRPKPPDLPYQRRRDVREYSELTAYRIPHPVDVSPFRLATRDNTVVETFIVETFTATLVPGTGDQALVYVRVRARRTCGKDNQTYYTTVQLQNRARVCTG